MKTIINCETGEILERELNAEEIKQQAADEKEYAKAQKVEADKLAAKQSAEAKLAALGLTEEEVASILGQRNPTRYSRESYRSRRRGSRLCRKTRKYN